MRRTTRRTVTLALCGVLMVVLQGSGRRQQALRMHLTAFRGLDGRVGPGQ